MGDVLAEVGLVAVPAAEPPVVSIIVVLHRGGVGAVEALRSITRHTPVPFEVIVIDNASPDASGAVVRMAVTGARMVFNATNRGFGGAMNQGVELARSPVAVLLNPDVVVHDGWLPPLLATLQSDPRCAAVSPRLLDPDGSTQEAGAVVDGSGHTHRLGSPGWQFDDEGSPGREVDYCSAACLAVRRSAFLSVGGFDDRYWPAYFEDVDLAFRWRRAGNTVRVEPSSVVTHVGGGTDVRGASVRLFQQNLVIFRRQWAAELATRPTDVADEAVRRMLSRLPAR